MFVWNFTTTSLSIADIGLLLLISLKRWSKIAVSNIAINACVLTCDWERTGATWITTSSVPLWISGVLVCDLRACWCMALWTSVTATATVTFELIPTCLLCWKLAFSVLVLKYKKNITTQEMQFIEILHTVPKWVLDNAVWVLLDCVIYCACNSILFRGPFFRTC